MVNLENIFNKLISEHDLETLYVEDFEISPQFIKDILVINKNNFDYMIFMDLDFDSLRKINNEIQISLATKFKDFLYSLDKENEITHFFEKNTYLIISTQYPNEITEKDLLKEVSIVEEDLYFFKKQILYYSSKELESLKDINFDSSLIVYFNQVISDINRYEKYLNNKDDEYNFITRFFEKIPFLKLEIEERELLNLDKMLNDELTTEELAILPELLELTNDNSINAWIKTLGEKK